MMKVTAGRNLASISFADLNKFKLEELANFVTVRKETNPLSKVKMAGFSTKGNPIAASQGKPCLLLCQKNVLEIQLLQPFLIFLLL
jgi:hypothetical protein